MLLVGFVLFKRLRACNVRTVENIRMTTAKGEGTIAEQVHPCETVGMLHPEGGQFFSRYLTHQHQINSFC